MSYNTGRGELIWAAATPNDWHPHWRERTYVLATNDRSPTDSTDSPFDRLAETPFHLVEALSLDKGDLVTVSSDASLRYAIEQMQNHRYSQIPVVDEGECRGVISLASITRMVASLQGQPLHLDNLKVQDALHTVPYVTSTDYITDLFKRMGEDEVLLMGDRINLQGVLTPVDLLNYMQKIAGPYILAQEVELALRHLIRLVFPEKEFDECVARALRSERDQAITDGFRLEDLAHEQLERIITHGENWSYFQSFLGERTIVRLRLLRVRNTRNLIMHHKEISIADYDHLAHTRNLLLECSLIAERAVRNANRISV